MSKQSGYIYEVVEGVYKGRFAISIHKEQEEKFEQIKKVFVHFYSDSLCLHPIKTFGDKDAVGLVGIEKLKLIGFSD